MSSENKDDIIIESVTSSFPHEQSPHVVGTVSKRFPRDIQIIDSNDKIILGSSQSPDCDIAVLDVQAKDIPEAPPPPFRKIRKNSPII